ncbi:MAG: DUF4199 domain-containing protein [Nanoarchaeota archaeon]
MIKLPSFFTSLKPELRFGLIIGLGVSLWVLIEFLLGFHTTRMEMGQFTGYLSVIIPILALYYGLTERYIQEPTITYWQTVKVGMTMVIIAAIIISLFMALYNTTIHPDWVEEGIAYEKQYLQEINATAEEITQAEEAMKVMFSTEVQMIGSFIGVVVQGFFLCLLISWLIRRK